MQPPARPQPQAFLRCLRARRARLRTAVRPALLPWTSGTALIALAALGATPALAQDAAPSAPAPAVLPPTPEQQIRFEADKLQYANDTDVVTAAGNVVMRREDQTVRADAISWNRKTGQIEAIGNIRFVDTTGNVLYTDKVQLTDELKAGAIEDMLLVLREGGRLAARTGTRDASGNMILNNAAYTGCAIEDEDGCPKKPSWEITAVRVYFDAADKRVKYKGATLRVFGVPLLPLPGLGHTSDFRGESGLLIPDFRLSASNGIEVADTYYFRLAENRDLAITGSIFTQALPMVSAKYRQLFDKGAFQATGYLTQSRRIAGSGISATGQNDMRGYININGRFQLSENWSVTGFGRYASDRTFLRRYDISREDRLRSSINLERIAPDSYFSIAGWATQTLRIGVSQGLVPVALPVIDYRKRLSLPGIGGKLELEANSLAITRTSGQDTQRAFARAQWDLRKLTGMGQEVTFTALLRGDVYHSDANALTTTALYRGNPGWQGRGIATAAVDVKWPLVGGLLGGTQVLTPRVQVVATPSVRNIQIPNEDSRAVDLEDTNLFSLNRFPGNDRIEGGVRFTYGLDWQLTRPGWRVASTIGQSYRLSNQSNLLPDGTGLTNRVSDIVGRTDLRFGDIVKLTHRFRLDKNSLSMRRNEIDATLGNHRTYIELGYLRLNRNIDPTFEDLQNREELRLAGRISFAHYWSVFASGNVNLTSKAEDPTNGSDGFQMLRHRLGFAYTDNCLDFSLTWRRDYVSTGDAASGNVFQITFSLRNLGVQ